MADQQTVSDMNAALCDFYKRWISDGDYLRCMSCKRAHIASKANQKFVHASGCPAEQTAEDYPWQVLLRLLRPLYAQPQRPAVPEEWRKSAEHIVYTYDQNKKANNEFGQKAAFASAIGLLREALTAAPAPERTEE